jgi:putative ABC transport system permease protein
MTSAWLAWRTTTRYRARSALAMIGVAVISALLFDMLLLSHGLVDSFADLLEHAGYDVRVLSTEGVPLVRAPIPQAAELAVAVGRLPEVESVARVRFERAVVTTQGRPDVDVALLGTTATGTHAAWTLRKGAELPNDPSLERCPLIVAQRLATAWALVPGSTVSIRATLPGRQSALPAVGCRVVGTADFLFASADEYDVATTMQGMREVKGGAADDEADLVLVASRPRAGPAAAVRAIAKLRPDLRVYSNEDVVAQFNRNGFAYFRQISVVLSSMTVVFAFLLVGTLLTVSTNQRLGEIAALRALGIGRPRIASMLLYESALLVGGGGVLALPLGGMLAFGLDRILRQMPGVPERLHFFVFAPGALALHLALLAATAIIAASYPIWLTARLPIASTLRHEVVG